MDDDVEDLLDAARGDIPEEYGPALGYAISPDGRSGVVLLGTNGLDDPYPYEVVCVRRREGEAWQPGIGSNGMGWTSTADDGAAVGVMTRWGEAPGASRAVVAFGGEERVVPVEHGWYLAVFWDVPSSRASPAPRLVRTE
jgi:hypothetical protein